MKENKKKELSKEQFRKMQLVQLDMLVDFDRVCRKNKINYVIFGGTMLGAIRHKGYIPWDDDADIAMLREDYEKFKKHMNELDSNICYFQDNTTDPYYRWGYGKLRRTGTKYVRVGQEHLKSKNGIFIDVFPMDDIPKSIFFQIIQDVKCFCLRKILWSEVAKVNSKGFMKLFYNLLSKISTEKVYRIVSKMTSKSSNLSPNRVRTLLFPATGTLYKKNPLKERYGMPKEWFIERKQYNFENVKLYGTKDYDTILKYIYGDYMKLPDEDKREPHSPFSEISFPKNYRGGKNDKKNN